MKITFLRTGKTSEQWLQKGITEYEQRIRHYVPLTVECVIPRNLPKQDVEKQKTIEGDMLLGKVEASDELYLLDEHGQSFSSEELASFLQKKMSAGTKRLVLAVGGPYGFSQKVIRRANGQISLSRLTFPHQMTRLLLAEQIYRACTILRGEPYHH
ncbi:MAG: 23S rRNA (pseudouridine(1915)-N(3))-methyltransferase RlmH [Bacteroidales bacterium]|jgi:23S rRNA (pseudouridine1915-N3)-methyltransferase|nr:23S rRNA (pseudouridine(1915)-N(3))-methyltransferase RlmH [Bacteroidales bacterium]